MLLRGIIDAIGDVFLECGAEYEWVLPYDAYMASEVFNGDISDIHVVQFDASLCYIVESGYEVDYATLTTSRCSQYCDGLSWLYVEVDVL